MIYFGHIAQRYFLYQLHFFFSAWNTIYLSPVPYYKKNKNCAIFRAVQHPGVPETQDYVRVHSYQSKMVIRPHKTFDEVNRVYHKTDNVIIGQYLVMCACWITVSDLMSSCPTEWL